MKLTYIFRSLFRQKGNNLIKIISLTLGLVVGLLLFSQVAFEMSYDNFYAEKENLYRLQLSGTINEEPAYDQSSINYPFAPTMYEEMDEVMAATSMYNSTWELALQTGELKFKENVLVADELLFQTLGYDLLVGDFSGMANPRTIYLSETTKDKIFGDENAIGNHLLLHGMSLQIEGVFADIPKNSHLHFDALISMTTIFPPNERPGWQNGDAFHGYVRLAPGISPKMIEEKIPEMMRRYYDVDAEIAKGVIREVSLKPIVSLHTSDSDVKRSCVILSILAFSLLLAAGMNYVLISISSLAGRAKAVGIHKCNGASDTQIFKVFLYETIFLIFISLLLAVLIIFSFRSGIETLLRTDLFAIFSIENLWVTGLILISLFLVTGVIPARIFSSIPVTRIFRGYSDNKKGWKRSLLFTQFAGIAFIMTLLAIIVSQYHMVLNQDLGYTTEDLLYSQNTLEMSEEQILTAKSEFERLPEVASVGVSSHVPVNWLQGSAIKNEDNGETLFSGRFMSADKDFFDTYELELILGNGFRPNSIDLNEIVVNETFANLLNVENPIGYKVHAIRDYYTICGVVKDYQYQSFFEENPPIFIMPAFEGSGFTTTNTISVRLNTRLTKEFMERANTLIAGISPDEETHMIPYTDTYEWSYRDTRLFKNSVTIAASIMLLITIMGLLGFVQDEVTRRRKEIAVRKVNGAEVLNILSLLIKDISYIALPAILIGLMISYKVGAEWLQQFIIKIPLGVTLFSLSTLSVLSIIILCVVIRSWSVANENPIHSLKSE